jgi:hypothetical protein
VNVRKSIFVRRDSGLASYLIGNDVCKVLSSIKGVSAPVVDRQYIDRADLSYESNDSSLNFEQIDRLLEAKGMRRM